jgi:origin recognition complex subunit 4
MSDFDPSRRSSKRRKTTYGSAKAKSSASVYQSISHTVNGISRRLFKSKDSEDELADESQLPSLQDSAYGSKEDSVNGEQSTRPVTAPLTEQTSGAGESADELALPEVTATPTKSQRKRVREPGKTPKTAQSVDSTPGKGDQAEGTPVQKRSSGRQRKRPRRFSNSLEDNSEKTLPMGVLTSSRKRNKPPGKTVAFDQDEVRVTEDLGFKDPDKSAKKKTEKANRTKRSRHGNEAQGQAAGDFRQSNLDVVQDDEPKEVPEEDERVPDVPELPDIAPTALVDSLPSTDSRLDPVKSLVLSRLTGNDLTPLTNLDSEYSKLHTLLSATITAGEGNSILLLGSRGVGKTCLVETAIADLSSDYAEDFHVVRLNGFVQTDNKLALREIWRQLGREVRAEQDETAQVSSYADTMASLLHLLSHPEELAETLEPDAPSRTTKSVLFVLDEFDLFTTHPRQTLLYNLFDIAQARKAPIAVIGCSARIDVSDNLEKRVKSRFSHRWIHLSQAKSFPTFEEIAKAALRLSEHDQYQDGCRVLENVRSDWNAFIEVR